MGSMVDAATLLNVAVSLYWEGLLSRSYLAKVVGCHLYWLDYLTSTAVTTTCIRRTKNSWFINYKNSTFCYSNSVINFHFTILLSLAIVLQLYIPSSITYRELSNFTQCLPNPNNYARYMNSLVVTCDCHQHVNDLNTYQLITINTQTILVFLFGCSSLHNLAMNNVWQKSDNRRTTTDTSAPHCILIISLSATPWSAIINLTGRWPATSWVHYTTSCNTV